MKQLTPNEYVRELNRRLAMHPEFRLGMKFLNYPIGSGDGASGIEWEPKNLKDPFIEISTQMQNEFVVLSK